MTFFSFSSNAKLIDMGSAFEQADPPPRRTCTPTYAAPEVLEGAGSTPQSDVASLGYVLVELLSGRPCFPSDMNFKDLLEAKLNLSKRLRDILPEEVVVNSLLMNVCKRLVAADPSRRFNGANDAELLDDGEAFHRQLVMGDLASEYERDLQKWLEEVHRAELANDSTDADSDLLSD